MIWLFYASCAVLLTAAGCAMVAGMRRLRREHDTDDMWASYDDGHTGELGQVPYAEQTIERKVAAGHPPWPVLHNTARTGPQWPLDVASPAPSPQALRPDVPAGQAGLATTKPPLRGDDQGWESSAETVAISALAGDRSLESGSLSPRLTGKTLAGATAGQATTDDSGLLPAVRDHVQAALGVPSRRTYLDAFDRIYADACAELDAIRDRLGLVAA